MSIFYNAYNENTASVVSGLETLRTETQDINKEIEDLRYILDNTFASLNQRMEAEEELSNTFNQSIDNLLLLIAFVQRNIVLLQESHFVTNAKITALKNTPFYKRITVKQLEVLLSTATLKAEDEFAPTKEKELKNITEVINSIHKRREEK